LPVSSLIEFSGFSYHHFLLNDGIFIDLVKIEKVEKGKGVLFVCLPVAPSIGEHGQQPIAWEIERESACA
jgi:hypothetical protein